jgi:heterodisulfide reductase subunit C
MDLVTMVETDEEKSEEKYELNNVIEVSDDIPVVTIKDIDSDFKYEIVQEPGGENFLLCFQCGTCTASCPVKVVDESFNARRIIRMALLGLKEEVLKSEFIWLCSTCYTCYERCPKDVKITEVMNAIKNIAVREGYIHPSFKAQVELLKEHGRLIEISDFENKMRAKLGLPSINESAKDTKKIFDKMKLEETISGDQ